MANKFGAAFAAINQTVDQDAAEAATIAEAPVQLRQARKEPARRVGSPVAERQRELGKRSHPDYRQVALHMRADTHFAAVDRLRHRREYADFGELVQELVAAWLAKK